MGLAWPLIIALGLTQIAGYGSVFYSFALLAGPVQQTLGLPPQSLVGAFSVALLSSGLSAPWVGVLIDRHGGRGVMTAGSVLAGAMLALMSRVQSAQTFYAAWMGIGLAMACILYEPAFAVLTQVHQSRARRAITMVTLLGGFASSVFWPLGQVMIDHWGWRGACLCLALVQWLICAPLHWFSIGRRPALPDSPEPEGAARRRSSPPNADALRQAFREPTFYWLAGAFVSYQFVFSSTAVHLIPMFQAKGLSAVDAAAIGALLGPMQVLGRVVELTFGARMSIARVGGIAVFFMPCAMAWLYAAPGTAWALALFPLIYGAGNGVMTIVRGALPVELYGAQRYATISGALAAPALISTACGPLVSSMLWSPVSGYGPVALALSTIGLAGAGCFHAALRYRTPTRHNTSRG
jgi:MFS family permease